VPNFTAIDFETAQPNRWSICQVGIVRVEGGRVVDTVNRLIQPPDNYYWYRFTGIHGISSRDTIDAPGFDAVWPEITQYIQNQCVVAHNGSFDFGCLKSTLEYYRLGVPEYRQACTYKIYGKNLASLCDEHQIPLNHHDALSDAFACAELYVRHLTGNRLAGGMTCAT
jgi:DNA polymerase-3 subunit epsilon